MSERDEAPSAKPPQDGPVRWILVAILVAYLGLGIAYILLNPWGGGLDEPLHANYVKVLAEERRLPWIHKSADGWTRYREAHAMHPPVYHITQVPLYMAVRGSEATSRIALRLSALALGALTVVLVFVIARRTFCGHLAAATAVTVFYALMPHTLLISSVVNNDIASVLVFLFLLYLGAIRWAQEMSWTRVIALGVVAGIAGLTKGTCEVAGFPMMAVLIYLADRQHSKSRALLKSAASLVVAVALVAPWHIRNMRLYGSLSFMPDDGPNPYLPETDQILVKMMHDNFPGLVKYAFVNQVNTLWAQEDWIPVRARALVYGALWACLLVGAILTVLAFRRKRERLAGRVWVGYLAATAPLWAMALYIALFEHFGWCRGGRYLLCILPAVGSLIFAGMVFLGDGHRKAAWGVPIVTSCLMLAFNLLCMAELAHLVSLSHHAPGA